MFLALSFSAVAFFTITGIYISRYRGTTRDKKKRKYLLRGVSVFIVGVLLLYLSYGELNRAQNESTIYAPKNDDSN